MKRLLLVALACAVAGCHSPSQENVALRKENQTLTAQVAELSATTRASAGMHLVTAAAGAPGAVDVEQLVTPASISFGRLTLVEGNALHVYVTPADATGDEIKSAGTFDVLAYDLTRGKDALAGHWTFTAEQSRTAWNGKGLLYAYVLDCPLTATPAGDLRLHVTYTDLLTGRKLEAETQAPLRH